MRYIDLWIWIAVRQYTHHYITIAGDDKGSSYICNVIEEEYGQKHRYLAKLWLVWGSNHYFYHSISEWSFKVLILSQESVERANQDIESVIATWMEINHNAKWSESLRSVQAMKNSAFHSG